MKFDKEKAIKSIPFAILSILIFFTGGYASIYSSEIKKSFPFTLFETGFSSASLVYNIESIVFWLLFIIVVVTYIVKEAVKANHEEDLRNKLISNSNEIAKQRDDVIRELSTVPPKKFISSSKVAFDVSWKLYKESVGEDADKIREAIRGILVSICRMARVFDETSDPSDKKQRYAANIMVYIESNKLNDHEKQELQKILKFTNLTTSVDRLNGVLLSCPDLSVAPGESDEFDPDDSILDFCLPIPVENPGSSMDYTNVLPGAPFALAKGEMDWFKNTKELYEFCEHRSDLTDFITGNIKEYFESEQGRLIQSFAAIPFKKFKSDVKIGVLNIHKDGKEILINSKRAATFGLLIKPLRSIILDLLEELARKEGKFLDSKRFERDNK